jgi:hypothetical protein
MKLKTKIFFVIIGILAVIFFSLYIFLSFMGNSLLINQLEKSTQKKVTIGSFRVVPLLDLEIKDLRIGNIAKLEYLSVSPSILGFLMGRVALNSVKIVRPEFTFEKTSAPETSSSSAAVTTDNAAAPVNKKPRLHFVVKRLNIKDGKLNFIDHTIGNGGIGLTIKEIYFNLNSLYLVPRSVVANFELKGKIPWQKEQAEGRIEARGWLDLFKKNMQATLNIEDIDGIYLYPYYSAWVDLEKARIEKAKLNFTSNIQALNNDMIAQCRLELTDIVRRPLEAEEQQEKAAKIADAVLGVLKALDKGNVVLNFTIRTKMDKPQFGFVDIKMAFEDKLALGRKTNGFDAQDVLMLPAKILEGAVKGATDISKAVIDGTFAVGNEIKKSVEDSFKKEPKEEAPQAVKKEESVIENK